MKKRYYFLLCLISIGAICSLNAANNTKEIPQNILQKKTIRPVTQKPKMQVVFLLDATGSMSGLISAAKDKIWSITSSLTQTDPAPDIEVGMIFYRDRGDEFITKKIPLGSDLDNLYEQLMAIRADGGGDAPESVNQALYEGVNDMRWDDSENTYKTLFLVGDCPPHMDYRDDVKYPESCSEAKKKGIIVNTILMGNDPTADQIWKEIASKTNGEYIKTDMNVNNIVVRTPYDDRINERQRELDKTRIYYGESSAQMEVKEVQSSKMSKGDAAVNARRAEYNLSAAGYKSYYGSNELINDVIGGKKLSDIPEKELPDNLKKMSQAEREKYVADQISKRKALEKEILELGKQRQAHIDSELQKMDSEQVENSFDNVVFKAVQSQAETKNIKIEGKAKR
ncbi:Mg-chelatase subunit ChlD [Dysgonomonas hofstadii]|uniref:Mg-chelatase subunit ChlD n=1 Tax=Dysgonomonas hofstadii TaxID=637886 RepID=A0A840CJX6_9BACT|nr:vWA domain-containing protein [Dysgonomonas hofstadii]MBB4036260.1 Mg-chelatase subunit ChlD [Dysgonomonas hofstadii]